MPNSGAQFRQRLINAESSDEVFAALPVRGAERDRLNAILTRQGRTLQAVIDQVGKRLFARGTLSREIRQWRQKYDQPEAATKIERALTLHFKGSLPVFQSQLETSLNLRLCHLRDVPLPESVRFLTHLQTLDLRNNGLTFVPEVVRYLPGLTCLLLGFNQITQLPPWIEEFRSLHTLDLESNPKAFSTSSI